MKQEFFQRLGRRRRLDYSGGCAPPVTSSVAQWLDNLCKLKVRIHGAILRAMAELHRVSTPKFVVRNIARNIATVESRPTSATLPATNFFVYPPSAAFHAIV